MTVWTVETQPNPSWVSETLATTGVFDPNVFAPLPTFDTTGAWGPRSAPSTIWTQE